MLQFSNVAAMQLLMSADGLDSLDSFLKNSKARRSNFKQAVGYLLARLHGCALPRTQLWERARKADKIGSQWTFKKYIDICQKAALIRNVGTKARPIYEITELGKTLVENEKTRFIEIDEDAGYLRLGARLFSNQNLNREKRKAAERTLLDISAKLTKLANDLRELENERQEVNLALACSLTLREHPRAIIEVLEGSLDYIRQVDPSDSTGAWMDEWYQNYVRGLANVLGQPSPDVNALFGLIRYRSAVQLESRWPKVAEEIVTALDRLRRECSSPLLDAYRVSPYLLSLDSIYMLLNSLEESIQYLPSIRLLEKGAIPLDGLLKGSIRWRAEDQKLSWLLNWFEEWLGAHASFGGRKQASGLSSAMTRKSWTRLVKSFETFFKHTLRSGLITNAMIATRCLTFMARVPPDIRVTTAVREYLRSHAAELRKIRKFMPEKEARFFQDAIARLTNL